MKLTPVKRMSGEISVPGDKSISHRSVMLGSLAKGTTHITGFLNGADCLSTIDCFRKMGVTIELLPGHCVIVQGNGLHGLKAPSELLYTGNSGTTTRLLSGIMCGQGFSSVISGDASICKRPMNRVIKPLSEMGANITGENNGCTPLHIEPSQLKGIHYNSPVASAQVKSAVLLAGLYADSATSVTEPTVSRDHTERMLNAFGGKVITEGTTATVYPEPVLVGKEVNVPGDISSAAYFLAAGLLVPGSEILVKNVGINPTRDGIIEVIKKMGGKIEFLNVKEDGEPCADILVKSSSLHGTVIEGDLIPKLIDEIPVIAVMAALADGTTVIKDAAELKVKESDRILSVTKNLAAMGVSVEPTDDGMIIHGGNTLHGAVIDSVLDHRIAMSFAVASLIAEGETEIRDAECVNISYPDFYKDLFSLCERE